MGVKRGHTVPLIGVGLNPDRLLGLVDANIVGT